MGNLFGKKDDNMTAVDAETNGNQSSETEPFQESVSPFGEEPATSERTQVSPERIMRSEDDLSRHYPGRRPPHPSAGRHRQNVPSPVGNRGAETNKTAPEALDLAERNPAIVLFDLQSRVEELNSFCGYLYGCRRNEIKHWGKSILKAQAKALESLWQLCYAGHEDNFRKLPEKTYRKMEDHYDAYHSTLDEQGEAQELVTYVYDCKNIIDKVKDNPDGREIDLRVLHRLAHKFAKGARIHRQVANHIAENVDLNFGNFGLVPENAMPDDPVKLDNIPDNESMKLFHGTKSCLDGIRKAAAALSVQER